MPVPGKPKVIVQQIPYDVDMAPEVGEGLNGGRSVKKPGITGEI